MKIALIAAGALAASTLTGLQEASARDTNFGLTIAGQQGFIQIGGAGKNHGPKYKNRGYGNGYGNGYQGKKRHKNKYGYRPGYGSGNGPGYGYGYNRPYQAPYDLPRARAQGYCMYPNEIRRMLRYQGWNGFRVKKLTPSIAIIHSYRQGMLYRLKVNRCTGQMIRVKPLGGYGGYGYY